MTGALEVGSKQNLATKRRRRLPATRVGGRVRTRPNSSRWEILLQYLPPKGRLYLLVYVIDVKSHIRRVLLSVVVGLCLSPRRSFKLQRAQLVAIFRKIGGDASCGFYCSSCSLDCFCLSESTRVWLIYLAQECIPSITFSRKSKLSPPLQFAVGYFQVCRVPPWER